MYDRGFPKFERLAFRFWGTMMFIVRIRHWRARLTCWWRSQINPSFTAQQSTTRVDVAGTSTTTPAASKRCVGELYSYSQASISPEWGLSIAVCCRPPRIPNAADAVEVTQQSRHLIARATTTAFVSPRTRTAAQAAAHQLQLRLSSSADPSGASALTTMSYRSCTF